MSELVIVCDNCGAKYRLPASFSGDKAKCKQCGSVVDVKAQRQAAAAPKPAAPTKTAAAAPKAAAERPARSKAGDSAEKSARGGDKASRGSATEGRAARRGKRDEPAEGDEAQNKRGRGERPEKKSNTMLLVGGGVGALAIVAVIVVLSMGPKKTTPATTDQASTPPATTPAAAPAAQAPAQPGNAAAEGNANKEPALDAGKAPAPADATAAKDGSQPSETPAQKPVEKPAEKPAAGSDKATDPADPKRNWENLKTKSLDEVFDPKTLGEVTWPGDVTEEQKAEIKGLIDDIVGQGQPGIRAKPKLEKIGYAAIFGIVGQLRLLDYKSTDDQMLAWEFNKLLQSICAGMNAGFDAVNVGEDMDPRKADWNARTNRGWAQLLVKFPSQDAFEAWRKDRLQKGLDKK